MVGTGMLLTLQGLSKSFQGQQALKSVDLGVRVGEIHALVGQNGCGKSTLIKVLAGYYQPDPGGLASFAGAALDLQGSARPDGLRFVHQDLGLIGELNAVDNLALGATYTGRFWLSERREHAAARQLLGGFGIDIDTHAPVSSLSAAQRTMLALVRAVQHAPKDQGATLLVLDEVTAALPEQEVQQLFALVREIRNRGGSILYVTHRLGEVFDLADRATVLRDGRWVATMDVGAMDRSELVELIVGRSLEYFYPEPPRPKADVALTLSRLSGPGIHDVSLDIHRGEIVGVAGLVGSGYEELLALAFGALDRSAGDVRAGDLHIKPGSPHESIEAGLVYVPADRKRLAAVAAWTLRENVTLPKIPASGPGRWLSARAEGAEARPWLNQLEVVPPDTEALFSSLSGGNQQKVVLARWLRCGAKVMLLEEPTNGVDIGSKQAIYAALAAAAATGTAVLLSSSDAEELCAICDRVIVMRDGSIGAVLHGSALNVDRLTQESLHGTDLIHEPDGPAHAEIT